MTDQKHPTRPPGGTHTQLDVDAGETKNTKPQNGPRARQPGALPPKDGRGISGRGTAAESDEKKQKDALKQPDGSLGGRPEKNPAP